MSTTLALTKRFGEMIHPGLGDGLRLTIISEPTGIMICWREFEGRTEKSQLHIRSHDHLPQQPDILNCLFQGLAPEQISRTIRLTIEATLDNADSRDMFATVCSRFPAISTIFATGLGTGAIASVLTDDVDGAIHLPRLKKLDIVYPPQNDVSGESILALVRARQPALDTLNLAARSFDIADTEELCMLVPNITIMVGR